MILNGLKYHNLCFAPVIHIVKVSAFFNVGEVRSYRFYFAPDCTINSITTIVFLTLIPCGSYAKH